MNEISLKKIYNGNPGFILNLFKGNSVFRFTGADTIQSDFKTGGSFRLEFNNRGTIHGQFIKITDHEIILEWNVDGFNRPSETATIVEVRLNEENGACILRLEHKNIPTVESADAKRKAWMEILADIEQLINE